MDLLGKRIRDPCARRGGKDSVRRDDIRPRRNFATKTVRVTVDGLDGECASPGEWGRGFAEGRVAGSRRRTLGRVVPRCGFLSREPGLDAETIAEEPAYFASAIPWIGLL